MNKLSIDKYTYPYTIKEEHFQKNYTFKKNKVQCTGLFLTCEV